MTIPACYLIRSKMKPPIMTKFLFILILACLSFSNVSAKTIRIFGSDLFTTWLPEYYGSTDLSGNLPISFSLTGSYGGMIALQRNYADGLIYLQAENKRPEIPEGFEKTVIGYMVIYLYAPESYPGNEISQEMLVKIGNPKEPNTSITWEAILPNSDSWSQKSTRIVVDTGPNEILLSLFRLTFSQSETISDRMTITRSNEALYHLINKSDYFVLATSRCESPSASLKPLALSSLNESVAFPATFENVKFGDYSARFPIYLIYPENASWSQELLHVFQSNDFQKVLSDHNVLPKR